MKIERGVWNRTAARSRRIPLALMAASAACLTLLAACAFNKNPDENAEPVPPTVLRVENQAFLDMNIYIYRSSQRVRLGTANGNSTTRLTIPSNLIFGATPLRFQADPIGGTRQAVSQEITVSPGDEVTFIIPPHQ